MPTNLNIDDALLRKAQKLGKYRTKRETVNQALREFVQRREQLKIFDLVGRIDYDPNYDYKAQRRRA